MGHSGKRDRGWEMIQLTAKCKQCGGTGKIQDLGLPEEYFGMSCPACGGKGILRLTDTNWEITLKRVPPFSLREADIRKV